MKLFKYLLLAITLLFISGCDKFSNRSNILVCKGEILENHIYKDQRSNDLETRFKDTVSATITEKYIELKGPTELQIAQYIDEEGKPKIGYKFRIRSKDGELFSFNNYNCESKNIYPSFEVYGGEFNSITGNMIIQTRDRADRVKINMTQRASYICSAN